MKTDELFLASDAALRSVIDRITPADFNRPVPAEWSSTPDPTVLDILTAHAYDEAWIPFVVTGTPFAGNEQLVDRDAVLGDDPIASYDKLNDAATAVVTKGVDLGGTFHFQYGDYSAEEGFAHMATYRGFQAWSIAKHLGIPFHLSPELIDGFNENVVPHADEWRQWQVFGPAIDPPAGADAETTLLCTLGYWVP